MSLVKLTNEEKVITDYIIKQGYVPEVITIHLSDYFSQNDIHQIEEVIATENDRVSKTFINNILRDNR